MHRLAQTPITLDCFEIGDYNETLEDLTEKNTHLQITKVYQNVEEIIDFLEYLRLKFLKTNDMRYWKELIRWLPESWLQTRTWTANYEVIYNIEHQRKYHKLGYEWGYVLDKLTSLPYYKEFTN